MEKNGEGERGPLEGLDAGHGVWGGRQRRGEPNATPFAPVALISTEASGEPSRVWPERRASLGGLINLFSHTG